jgi:TM2 domain-containing membrane protein YozV
MPSPELNLKTALSLIDEVAAQIEPFKQSIDQHNASLQNSGERNVLISLTQGITGKIGIAKESKALIQKCDEVISLSNLVKSSNPDTRLLVNREGENVQITPDILVAHSYVCKGIIAYLSNKLKDSQSYFEQSMQFFPTADAQLRIGYSILGQGERDESLEAFKKVVQNYPDSEEAVEANKMVVKLDSLKPRKWIVALILSIFLAGFDRMYLGYYKDGIIKLLTLGGFFIWWIIDIIRIAGNNLRDVNGLKLQK